MSTIKNIYSEFLVLKSIYFSDFSQITTNNYRWKILVSYDEKFGIDLQEISQKKGLEIDAIINLHFSQIYTVFFIGFLPVFLYLGGLDKQLFFNRKSTPRLNIKKVLVGIGRIQTRRYFS